MTDYRDNQEWKLTVNSRREKENRAVKVTCGLYHHEQIINYVQKSRIHCPLCMA